VTQLHRTAFRPLGGKSQGLADFFVLGMNPMPGSMIIAPVAETHVRGQRAEPARSEERAIMLILLRAAIAAVSLASIGSAYGADSQVDASRRPAVILQLSQQPPAASEQPVSRQSGRSPWLFPPIGRYLAG
jgi:hypothetical protein